MTSTDKVVELSQATFTWRDLTVWILHPRAEWNSIKTFSSRQRTVHIETLSMEAISERFYIRNTMHFNWMHWIKKRNVAGIQLPTSRHICLSGHRAGVTTKTLCLGGAVHTTKDIICMGMCILLAKRLQHYKYIMKPVVNSKQAGEDNILSYWLKQA